MAKNQHRNLTGDALHNPKGFDGASNGTKPVKDGAGALDWITETQLPKALDYVSAQSAPPTEVTGDVYLIDTTGTAYDINTIAWQSGNTIRIAFNGSPDLSAVAADDYFITSGNGNSSNDGTFIITTVNDGSDYIEITNNDRSDATDDEATDAVGTGYYTLAEWDAVSKVSHVTFDGSIWSSITPSEGQSCYDVALGAIRVFDGTDWSSSLASGGGLANVVEDTTPQLGGMLDVNGQSIGNGTEELLDFAETSSAVNHFLITNSATGNDPKFEATGDDANIGIYFKTKGTGNILMGNMPFDADQTIGAGQDNYVLTYDNATGLISLEAAGGGGSSLWTDNSDYISDTNHQFVEITSGSGNTYNATKNFTSGNLLVGDSNTLGGSNIRGTIANGALLSIGSTGATTDCFISGRSNTLQTGVYSMMQGQSNILNGTLSSVVGGTSDVYGDNSHSIGSDNDIGTSGARADYSFAFGKDVNTKSDYQMAIGYGVSQNFNTKPYIGFGLHTTGTQQPTAGFGIDPSGSATGAINFAMGGQNAFEDGIGINQNGAGNGIFYFHNLNGTRTVEPSVNIPHSVALWGADNTAGGQTGLIVKSEDGTRHFLSKYSAIGGDETVAEANKTLIVKGTGTTSGTSSLKTTDSGGTTTLEVLDNGTVKSTGQIGSSAGATPNTETPSGTTETIDWDNGNYQVLDLESASGNVTLTLSNPVAGFAYFIEIRQDSTTPLDVIFPSSVKFAGETAPYTLDVSTGANAVDAVSLAWNGSEYIASFSQNHG